MQRRKQLKHTKNEENALLKFFSDFLPLVIFFTVYKFSHHPQPIIPATLWLIASTIFALLVIYATTKKIAMMPLFSAIILGIFGGLTIFSGNEIFIKTKPTLLNLLFAIFLFTGYFFKKPLLKYLLAGALDMSKKAWMNLSLRWAWFFIFLAVLNEIIWRNFSTDFWVQFKVFGVLPLSIAFAIINTPFVIKESKKKLQY